MTAPPQPPGFPAQPAQLASCTWHPDRSTALSCSRCERPACPECLTPASVGFHCRACVAEARGDEQAAARTVAGARYRPNRATRPVVTYTLIAVNVAAFVVTALQARSVMDMSGSNLYLYGGLIPAEVSSEPWRVVTAGFLHGNLIHVATNMMSLYILGIPLERILGRARFVAIYALSLLGASASVLLFSAPVSLTIGASGAVYGLMGALLVTFKRLGYDLRQLIVVLAINVWVTFQFPGISWQGHMGGLVVGALVGAAMVYPPRATRRAWQIGTVVGVAVFLVALVVYRTGQIGDWVCVYQAAEIGCVPAHALR